MKDATEVFQDVIDRYLAAYAAHDAGGCAALYADRGEVYTPFGPPAKGRAEIQATHRGWFDEGETNKVMQVTRAGIDGDLGFCLVQFEADVPDGEGGVGRFRGCSLNVMERRGDGVWTIALTSLNELVELVMGSDR